MLPLAAGVGAATSYAASLHGALPATQFAMGAGGAAASATTLSGSAAASSGAASTGAGSPARSSPRAPVTRSNSRASTW